MKASLAPVYSNIDTMVLVDVYRQGPSRLREVVDGLSHDELTRRVRPEKWSIMEITIHLADAELVGAVRFRLTAAQYDVTLPGYRQDPWAERLEYNRFSMDDMALTLDLFETVRRSTARLMINFTDADWNRTARHPERGPMTIRQLLELYADHSERHMGQILANRTLLGKGIDMPLLLEQRLY